MCHIMGVLAKPEFLSGDMILVAEGVYQLGYDYSLGIQVNTNTKLSGGWNDSFTSQDNTTILENKTRGITIGKTVIVKLTRFEILAISDLGIYNSGELYSDHLTISSINDSAIYNEGVLSIDESMISQSGGCGIFNDGSVAISNTRLEDNYGCGITNDGTMEIDHSTIRGSVLRWGCTGISNTGNLRISQSSVTDNGSFYPNFGAGLCNYGEAIIANSTISGNNANNEVGGGIYNEGKLSLYNTTINDNQAATGGGIYHQSGEISIQNSLIAQNVSQDGTDDCFGVLTSHGYNLIGSLQGCSLINSYHDIVSQIAAVFPSQGDPPPYSPIGKYSPAIDSGDPLGCQDDHGEILAFDQRDVERSGRCDIGAYE